MTEDDIKEEAHSIIALEAGVATLEQELMSDPKFKQFLDMQKAVNAKATELWGQVQQHMIDNNIKNVKGDSWGSLTIVEKVSFAVDNDLLPKKFTKVVPDNTKISHAFKLEGKPPKGATPKYSYYLMKRLK